MKTSSKVGSFSVTVTEFPPHLQRLRDETQRSFETAHLYVHETQVDHADGLATPVADFAESLQ